MTLYSQLFYSTKVNELLSEENNIGLMLQVEAVLAESQMEVGLVPKEKAEIIATCCDIRFVEFDRLKADIHLGGNAAIPLVKQLIRIVKNNDFEASKYVHMGATSQDIVDTATVLRIKAYIDWLEASIDKLASSIYNLSKENRSTVMIGRTLLQQAKPITFGLKTAGWLQGIIDAKARLAETKKRVLQIQLAGAVGSGSRLLSSEVREQFAKKLGLENRAPWQAARGNLVEWISSLGILAGQLGKIAKDVSLLMQTEISEVLEGAGQGKGGSSTMPHKRNPVTCTVLIANAHRIPHLVATVMSSMVQEHERSAGLWHSEWETMDQIMGLTAGSLEKAIELIDKLEVNPDQMLKNLETTNGLIFAENVSLALAKEMGKGNAHEWVEKACHSAIETGRHLKEVISESEKQLPNLDDLFDPVNSIGHSREFTDVILKNYETQL